MSEQGQAQIPVSAPTPTLTSQKPSNVFSLSAVKRSVPVRVHFPQLYPGLDPFEFQLRMKFSKDVENSRQEFLTLSATDQVLKQDEQNLIDLCDLLTEKPKGFDDLTDGPAGPTFMSYVKNADPEAQQFLFNVVNGALTVYWRTVSPQEFRSKV